ncbi:MAG: ATP-binding cassette domain-containing protein [Candidatus Nanopusillus sp.]
MLKIEGLNVYSDNKKILENVNLEFEYGKLYLVFGPNGSGKTTLAKAILNDESLKKDGKIILDNIDITNEKTENIAKHIFYSFQDSVEIENIRTRTLLMHILDNFDEKKILDLGKNLGLPEDFLDRGINYNLSGGEKKRFSLLLSILLNRNIIIFDEIDSGADIEFLNKLKYYLGQLKKENRMIILISHNLKFAKELDVDKVIILIDRKVKYVGDKSILDKIEKNGFNIF